MATPRRRSSRLHGNSTPQVGREVLKGSTVMLMTLSWQRTPNQPSSAVRLATVSEHVQTPEKKQTSIVAAVSAPPKTTMIPAPLAVTPQAARRTQMPDSANMHPQKHHSTVKKLGSANRLDIASHSNITPTRKAEDVAAPTNPFSSATFDFKFKRPSTEMSLEAQKLMEDIRATAASYREKMSQHVTLDESSVVTAHSPARKIKSAKGKIGRFSDVHLQEFKKMNSIANHPSAFRAIPITSSSPPKNLKRTKSKAELNLARSPIVPKYSPVIARADEDKEPTSPAKRLKLTNANVKSPGQVSRPFNAGAYKSPSGLGRFKTTNFPYKPVSRLTNPTKASLARLANMKLAKSETSKIQSTSFSQAATSPSASSAENPMTTDTNSLASAPLKELYLEQNDGVIPRKETALVFYPQLPGLFDSPGSLRSALQQADSYNALSPSVATFSTPQPSRIAPPCLTLTGYNHKIKNPLANTCSQVRSILRRPQLRFSNDPAKIAAGTHVATPKRQENDLRTLSQEAKDSPSPRKKHVNFTPDPDIVFEYTPRPKTPPTPSPGDLCDAGSVVTMSQGIGQVSPRTSNKLASTIRHVRSSTLLVSPSKNTMVQEQLHQPKLEVAGIQHGLSNKKRKRVSDDVEMRETDENKENLIEEITGLEIDTTQSPRKKIRTVEPKKDTPMTFGKLTTPSAGSRAARQARSASPSKRVGPSASKPAPGSKGKGFLTLSRLNALSKPKERR